MYTLMLALTQYCCINIRAGRYYYWDTNGNRFIIEMEGVVGMFINTIAIRTFPKAKSALIEYLREVRMSILRECKTKITLLKI